MVALGCGGSSTPAVEPASAPAAAEAPVPAADATLALVAAEAAARDRASPVFEKYCTTCHTYGGSKATPASRNAFSIELVPFTSTPPVAGQSPMDTAKLREVLAIGGGKATMPMDNPGAVTGDELALIAVWVDAYDAAHAK